MNPSAQIAGELLGSEPMAPECPHMRSSNHQSETLHETRGSPLFGRQGGEQGVNVA